MSHEQASVVDLEAFLHHRSGNDSSARDSRGADELMWYPKQRFLRSALFPLIVIVIVVFVISQILAGCGEESASGSGCVGEVTDKYTEYKPGVGVTSGSITIPTGSTAYYIAIKKSDGTFCAKKLNKNDWLAVQEGESFG